MVTTTTPDECYDATDIHGGVTENAISAGVSNGVKEAFEGVSGGPLAVCGQLVGILSW